MNTHVKRVVSIGCLIVCVMFSLATATEVSPRAAIGWKLFFDPLLSRPQNMACATCHNPSKGFADGVSFSRGAYGDTLPRHTPSVVNLRDAQHFFWDGRTASLEEQALVPLTNPIEMDMTVPEIVARVAAQPHYRRAFTSISVTDITIEAIVGAIATFERTLITGQTPFDRWLQGDMQALSPAQKRGRMIFFTRGQCAICHIGANLTDDDFHNTSTGTASDLGRYGVTGKREDRGLFKTPSLRNWKGREPFMHDGRFATMLDVLNFYSAPLESKVGESELDPLELTDADKEDLVAFLETLNGAWPDLSTYAAAWEALMSHRATGQPRREMKRLKVED